MLGPPWTFGRCFYVCWWFVVLLLVELTVWWAQADRLLRQLLGSPRASVPRDRRGWLPVSSVWTQKLAQRVISAVHRVSESSPSVHPHEGGREVNPTSPQESPRRLRAASASPGSRVPTHGQGPHDWWGVNVCQRGSLHPRWAVAGFAALFFGEFHTQEPLAVFPAEAPDHQNDCVALGKLSKPTECGCREMIQAPARSRCWAGLWPPSLWGIAAGLLRGDRG